MGQWGEEKDRQRKKTGHTQGLTNEMVRTGSWGS